MNKDTNLLFEAYTKTLKEAKLDDMSSEDREAYEAELEKKEAYKDSLLRNDKEEESGGLVSPEEFINRIKKDFKSDYHNHHSIYFGKITEGERAGQMYALVYSSEDYSDGDRWLTDEYQQLFYNKLKPDGKWFETSEFLKKEQAKALEDKAIKEHPELNKDIIDLRKSFNQTNSENAEEKALDAIGNKRVTKEQARQIADKYTNGSHEELMKMSSAYNNGFNHELQGIADYNDYKEDTLNYYLYEFGVYEALTSH